jgi:hypothetical protein
MEPTTTQPLDIRTLMLLLVEHEMPRDKVFALLAHECNVPVEKLVSAVTVVPVAPVAPVKYARWDDERINTLVALWNAGMRPSKIAAELETTTSTVYQKISQLRKVRSDINKRVARNSSFPYPRTISVEVEKVSA